MKVDTPQAMPRDCILTNFTLEAGVYDIGKWHGNDEPVDLLASVVTQMELIPPPSFRFNGYHFKGKIDSPKLWSAEQVRIHLYKVHLPKFCLR